VKTQNVTVKIEEHERLQKYLTKQLEQTLNSIVDPMAPSKFMSRHRTKLDDQVVTPLNESWELPTSHGNS
jgi:hypothetical protein